MKFLNGDPVDGAISEQRCLKSRWPPRPCVVPRVPAPNRQDQLITIAIIVVSMVLFLIVLLLLAAYIYIHIFFNGLFQLRDI